MVRNKLIDGADSSKKPKMGFTRKFWTGSVLQVQRPEASLSPILFDVIPLLVELNSDPIDNGRHKTHLGSSLPSRSLISRCAALAQKLVWKASPPTAATSSGSANCKRVEGAAPRSKYCCGCGAVCEDHAAAGCYAFGDEHEYLWDDDESMEYEFDVWRQLRGRERVGCVSGEYCGECV